MLEFAYVFSFDKAITLNRFLDFIKTELEPLLFLQKKKKLILSESLMNRMSKIRQIKIKQMLHVMQISFFFFKILLKKSTDMHDLKNRCYEHPETLRTKIFQECFYKMIPFWNLKIDAFWFCGLISLYFYFIKIAENLRRKFMASIEEQQINDINWLNNAELFNVTL